MSRRARVKPRAPKPGEMDRPLNMRQTVFVDEYLRDLNGTKAAQRAGYSRKSAHSIAVELLRNPKIAVLIQEGMDKRAKRLEISADNVLREIARLALSDMRRVVKWSRRGVKLRSSDSLTDDDAAMVSEISQIEDVRTGKVSLKIKVHDKTGNLGLLARHLRLVGGDDQPGSKTPEETAATIKQLLAEMDTATGGPDGK